MSQGESKEMYLETIYILEQQDSHAHSAKIAKRLGVSKPDGGVQVARHAVAG